MFAKKTLYATVIGLGLAAAGSAEAAPVLWNDYTPRTGALVQIQWRETSVDQMNPQMRHAYIIGIQEELAAHGYRPGPVDGVWGPQTTRAIQAYQRDAGLPTTGVVSKELLDHLKFAQPRVYARGYNPYPAQPAPGYQPPSAGYQPPAQPAPVYQPPPAYGSIVADAQLELQRRGYYDGAVDGLQGPMTRSAITQFQIDLGVPITGVADRTLLSQLQSAPPHIRR